MQANLGQQTWAPSAISLDLGKMSNRFNTPIEMTESMIAEVIQRFANTARLGEKQDLLVWKFMQRMDIY